MSIRLVVFDMAGTTVEDKNNVHEALISGFASQQLTITLDDANRVMGIPKPVAITQLLRENFGQKNTDVALVARIHNVFVKEMISFYSNDSSVKPKIGAEETFAQLHLQNIKVVLDTGFSRDIADTIIYRFNWQRNNLIDGSVTSDEVQNGRPYPDLIHKAMKDQGVYFANEVAKVGDTMSDLEEGTAAGCRYVIGITTGAYSALDLAQGPHTHLIENLNEVVSIVTQR